MAKHADLTATSVDGPIEAHGENVHDDTSVTDGGGNAGKLSSNEGATAQRVEATLDAAAADYTPFMGLDTVDSDVVLNQFQSAALKEDNVAKWDELLG